MVKRSTTSKPSLAEVVAEAIENKVHAKGDERRRGHATRVLRGRTEELKCMMSNGFAISEMVDVLAQADIHVHYHSLRVFLKKNLPVEYEANIALSPRQQVEGCGVSPINESDDWSPAP